MPSESEISPVNNPGSAVDVSIRGITKTYGDFHALDDIDLQVRPGEFMTLLGPSGSGKTTLLMVIAGFTRPDKGSLLFDGEEVIRKPPHLRNIGMVFQNYALFPHMSVEQNVAYPLKLRRLPRDQIARQVEDALRRVKLPGYNARRIDQLSGGQRQRVALARAIGFAPKILLMDEPLSALDKKLRDEMQMEIRALHDTLNMTTIYVTHDQKEALTMSDRICVINDGRLHQIGSPEDIYQRPQNRFIADFIGESTLLPVTVTGARCFFAKTPVRVPPPAPADGDYHLVVRPEKLFLAPDAAPGADANHFTGTIRNTVFQGDSLLVVIDLDGDRVMHMRLSHGGDGFDGVPAAGAPITVGLKRADSFLVA